MMKRLVLASALALLGCAGAPDPTAVITQACMADGVFKMAGGRLIVSTAASTVPGAGIAYTLATAGVDRVCANPAAFAGDIASANATAAWVLSNIRGAMTAPR